MSVLLSRLNILGAATAVLVAVPVLGGCSLDTETQVVSQRITLENGVYQRTFERGGVTGAEAQGVQEQYERFADGPVNVVVTYDPTSKTNTAMKAAEEAAQVSETLRQAGIQDIKTDLVPVKGAGAVSRTMLGFETVTAKAPEGCEFMGGVEGQETWINDQYTYGCTMQMLLARQIHRPADLAGNDARPVVSGRRQVNMSEPYVAGVPNEPLEGGLSVAD